MYFLFNSSFPVLQHHIESPVWNKNDVTDIDICYYIASLIPAVPDESEILIAQIIAIFNIGFAVCFVLLLFFINSVKVTFIQIGISYIWGYYLPFICILFSNIFVRSNLLTNDVTKAHSVLCSFLHTLLTLLMSIHGIFNSATPLPIHSPFFAKSCFDSFFLIFYFDLIFNIRMNFQTNILYVRSFISAIYSIFIIIKPPYLARAMNFLLLFCTSFDASCAVVSTFYDYPTFYCFLGSFAFSFIIFYIIYQFSIGIRNDVDRFIHLSFIGKHKEAQELLETLSLNKDEKYKFVELIELSIKYHSGRLLYFVNYFLPTSRTLENTFFFWTSKNVCKLQKMMFIDQDYQVINDLKSKSQQDYNEFWHRIWLSDTSPLIKLACQLGSTQMKKQLYALNNYEYNPKIVDFFDDYTKASIVQQIEKNKCKRYISNFPKFDIPLILSALLFLILECIFFHVNIKLTPILTSYIEFEKIQLGSISLHSKIIGNTTSRLVLFELIEAIDKQFDKFQEGTDYFAKEIMDETNLYENFELLKTCIFEKSDYVHECFMETSAYVKELISINDNRSILYTDTVYIKDQTKLGITIVSNVCFFGVIIIFIISIIYISIYMSSFVHRFLFIPKSVIVKIAQFDQSIEILNEMPSRWAKVGTLKYMPWTIATHVAFVFFFVLMYGTVEIHKHSSEDEADRNYLIMNCTSTILNIPLYIILGYDSFRNEEYYQSNLCTSNVTDIIEKLHFEPYISYLKYIPENIYDIVLLNFYNLSLANESMIASHLLDAFSVDMYRDINNCAYLPRYHIVRNLSFLYMTIAIFFVALAYNHIFGAMMISEVSMIKKLYDLPHSRQAITYLNSAQQKQLILTSNDEIDTRTDIEQIDLKEPAPIIKESSSLFELKSNRDDGDYSTEKLDDFEANAKNENENRVTFDFDQKDSILLTGLDNQENETQVDDDVSISDNQLVEYNDTEILENDIDMSVFPIALFAIDSDSNVIFATDLSIQLFQIEIGEPFDSSEIDISSINSMKNQIELFKKNKINDGPTLVILPTEQEDKSIIMKAHYFYSKRDIELKNVIIYFENAQFKPEIIEKKITQLFYQEFPKFVPIDTEFPIQFPPKLKSLMIVVLSLNNFNAFVENAIQNNLTAIVSSYRSDLSAQIFELIENQDNFTYIRETQNEFVAAFNHEQTSISVWKILETSAAFSKDLISIVRKLNEKYNITMIEPVIMLFKCKEPAWYASLYSTARIDWETDALLNAELFVKYGNINTINYSTQKKEMKSPNTTLLKSQKTPNGDPFNLFVVV